MKTLKNKPSKQLTKSEPTSENVQSLEAYTDRIFARLESSSKVFENLNTLEKGLALRILDYHLHRVSAENIKLVQSKFSILPPLPDKYK